MSPKRIDVYVYMLVELHNLMEPIRRGEVMARDPRTLEHDVVPRTSEMATY